MKLKDKFIIVTGGSTGIGLAVSRKIAQEGGIAIICARDVLNLIDASTELKIISGFEHSTYSLDVGNLEKVQEFVEWCKSRFEKIDGLVNCAGIYGPIGKTSEINLIEFQKAINVNLMGTIYMSSLLTKAYPTLKKIVNYSGGGAATPFPNYSAYATSKVAIVRFTENLALELLNQVEVNCIAPGFVATRIHQQTLNTDPKIVGEAFYENTKKQVENGAVSPEKAADLTSFLLSKDSDGITGKFISAPWDNWQYGNIQELLRTDKDFATLRRIDYKTFFKK